VTENSPVPSTAATPSLEIGPRDIPDTPPPPYGEASTTQDAALHDHNAQPQNQEETDQNIQEIFAVLQTSRGVAKGRFWQNFRQCSFCPFIVKKDSHHSCIPVIDLTAEDDIIDLTNDDDGMN